jgi:transcription termination factor NusB
MWTKHFRKSIIAAIYQNLFWQSLSGSVYIPDWENVTKEVYTEDEVVSIKELQACYNRFITSKETSTSLLQEYITKWDKTFDIVKAALFCFLLEYSDRKNEDDLHILGNYIKFAQDFAGGENPGLIHAVMSKMIEDGKI